MATRQGAAVDKWPAAAKLWTVATAGHLPTAIIHHDWGHGLSRPNRHMLVKSTHGRCVFQRSRPRHTGHETARHPVFLVPTSSLGMLRGDGFIFRLLQDRKE